MDLDVYKKEVNQVIFNAVLEFAEENNLEFDDNADVIFKHKMNASCKIKIARWVECLNLDLIEEAIPRTLQNLKELWERNLEGCDYNAVGYRLEIEKHNLGGKMNVVTEIHTRIVQKQFVEVKFTKEEGE